MKNKFIAILFLAFFLALPAISFSQVSFDNTFGNNGIVTTALNVFGHSVLNSAAVQNDGKIIAAGTRYNFENNNHDFAVVRFNHNGSLDNSFGTNGIVTTDVSEFKDELYSVAVQEDGKIVAGGYSFPDFPLFTLIRYNEDGSIDTAFGHNGIVTTAFVENCEIRSIIIQDDGKITAGGFSHDNSKDEFALARFNNNGTPDSSFGIKGKTLLSFGSTSDIIHTVALQNNQKIIAAGNYHLVRFNQNGSVDTSFGSDGRTAFSSIFSKSMTVLPNGKIIAGGYSTVDNHFALACYNEDGEPDSLFGSNGFAKTTIGLTSEITSLRILNNEKIIAAGNTYLEGTATHLAMACYNLTGQSDNNFGTNGIVIKQVGTWSNNILSLQIESTEEGDEKIYAAGSANYGNGGYQNFSLIRYNKNGSLDSSFGNNGNAIAPIGTTINYLNSIASQSDGKIIAAGSSLVSLNPGNSDFHLVRYNRDGTLDNSFGMSGIVATSFGLSNDEATSIVVQSDGKILAGGYTFLGTTFEFALARYLENGFPDNDFGTGGILKHLIGDLSIIYSIAVQSDEKIIAGGVVKTGNNHYFVLVRYNPAGTLDNSFGSGGVVITQFDTLHSVIHSIQLQSDGKIIAAGRYYGDSSGFALARYNPNGTPDTLFGSGGKTTTLIGENSTAFTCAIQNDNKIILAGTAHGETDDFALARYNPDGRLDSTFGTEGIVLNSIPETHDEIRSIVLQQDGKIVAAARNDYGTRSNFTLLRYNNNGELDNTFGENGMLTISPGIFAYSGASSILLQSSGEGNETITAGGYASNGSSYSVFSLARFLNDPATGTAERTGSEVPSFFNLEQNYPNPFNPVTYIEFRIPDPGFVSLKVYDILGNEAAVLVNEEKPAGVYKITFNAESASGGFASGVYLYKLTTGNSVQTKKMILLK